MRTGVQTSSSSSVRSGLQPCPLYLIITCHQEYLHFFARYISFFLATVPTVSYYHLHSIASSRIFLPFFRGYFSSGAIKGFFLHQLHHKHSVAEIGVLLMGTFPEGQLKCFSFLMAIFSKISCFLSANDPNCNLFVLDLFNLSILTFG